VETKSNYLKKITMPKRKPGSTLTDKEKMFCAEYIIDLDATNAAIRAGYSEDSASSIAYHLKQRPAVEAYIHQLLDEKMLRLRITADDVLLELAKIAFAEITDNMENDEPEEANAAVHEIPKPDESQQSEPTLKPDETGAPKYTAASMCRVTHTNPVTGTRTITWFNLQAKIAALKILAKYLGLFEKPEYQMEAPLIIEPRDREETNGKQ
jgi:phage terminase small subunit